MMPHNKIYKFLGAHNWGLWMKNNIVKNGKLFKLFVSVKIAPSGDYEFTHFDPIMVRAIAATLIKLADECDEYNKNKDGE